MKEIRFAVGTMIYDLTLRSKYVIVNDLSGTGKTTFFKINRSNLISISSGIDVVYLPDLPLEALETALKTIVEISENEVLFIADEEHSITKDVKLQGVLNTIDAYFLLVGRSKFAGIPYGVDEIYRLESVARRHNKFIQRFPQLFKVPKVLGNTLYTEDKMSGYHFFAGGFERVAHCDGKANVTKYVESRKNGTFIVDSLGFGSEMVDTMEILEYTNYRNHLFLVPSFEWLILTSPLFQQNVEFQALCRNREAHCEQQLKQFFILNGMDPYSKSEGSKCIDSFCCFTSDKCRYFTRSVKSKMILGDLYDSFVAAFGLLDFEKNKDTLKEMELK